MYAIEKIKNNIKNDINQVLGKDLVKASDLVYPQDNKMGDLSLLCFELSKIMLKKPVAVASDLSKKIDYSHSVGPYLNFNIDKNELILNVLSEINNDYGSNQIGKEKKVMIEYSNVNTHKEYHIGHLRNISYGDSVCKILLANNYNVIPVTYINDFGIHVAKTLWALKKNKQDNEDKQDNENKDFDKGYLLGQTYVQATKDLENNEQGKIEVSNLMKNIESRSKSDFELWKETRQWSLDYFQSIYEKLKIKFEFSYYESDYIKAGLKLVDKLKNKGILKESQGAIIADLEKYDLGILVIIRSDGTALYPVADLALAVDKFKEKINSSIYVVDNRQSLYFKQLFKVLELMGYDQDMIHLQYDFVKLPSGMMSSRTGNTVTFENLYQEILSKIKNETKSRHEDWNDEQIEKVSKIITIGVLKFEMIKVSPNKIITFNIKEALRFDGFTSVYLQYTIARINSILDKESNYKNKKIDKIDFSKLTENLEYDLSLVLAKYPEIITNSAKSYEPSQIAKYLFDLARLFNEYYHNINIIKSEIDVKLARLVLISSVKQVLVNGLNVLGIEIVEKM